MRKVYYLAILLLAFSNEIYSQGRQSPSQSPDGKWFLFSSDEQDNIRKIYLADIKGNIIRSYGEGGSPRWSFDGEKILYWIEGNGITIVSRDGKNKKTFLDDTTRYKGVQTPNWLPDGKSIVLAYGVFPKLKIASYVLNTGELKDVYEEAGFSYGPSVSSDGKKIAFRCVLENDRGDSVIERGLKWVDPVTHEEKQFSPIGEYPLWSPDGTKLTFHWFDEKRVLQVFVVNSDGTQLTQLTKGDAPSEQPSWSHDGKKIYFQSRKNKEGNWELFEMNINGSGRKRLFVSDELRN